MSEPRPRSLTADCGGTAVAATAAAAAAAGGEGEPVASAGLGTDIRLVAGYGDTIGLASVDTREAQRDAPA